MMPQSQQAILQRQGKNQPFRWWPEGKMQCQQDTDEPAGSKNRNRISRMEWQQ